MNIYCLEHWWITLFTKYFRSFSPENGKSHSKSDEEDIYGTLPDIL